MHARQAALAPGRSTRRVRCGVCGILPVIVALCGLLPMPATAQQANQRALDELRGRIEKLNRDIAKREETRGEITDQLRSSEKAISDVNRSLAELARDQSDIQKELAGVERRRAATKDEIARQNALLQRLLQHQYMYGGGDALRLILMGEEVSAVQRQFTYLGYVARARATGIAALRRAEATLALLDTEAREKSTRLGANAEAQKKARAALLTERGMRQRTLEKIRADIVKSRREIGRLKRDEDRLTRLVQEIAQALGRSGRGGQRVTDAADASAAGRAFESLRGRLRLPVRGELVGRFGSARETGGVTWRGLFIRAGEGQAVKSVADGRVVYADWLRGFGNLVIVDHGGGYLSLYGNNESLLKRVGEAASAGETLALVGSTGGAEEAGVYFELRQDGKPFDPMRWVGK